MSKISHNIIFTIPFLVLLLFSYNLSGQDGINIRTKAYTTHDGLSDNVVTSITQDSKGFLWIGTQAGLNRFDGYSFIPFNSQNQDTDGFVNEMIFDLYSQDNTLWICASSGLWKYSQAEDIFEKQFPAEESLISPTVLFNRIFPGKDSTFWLMNDTLIIQASIVPEGEYYYKIDKKIKFEEKDITSRFNHIYLDQYDQIWVAANDALHSILLRNDMEAQYIGKKTIVIKEAVSRIIPIDENNFYIIHGNTQISTYNMHTRILEDLPDIEIPSDPFSSIDALVTDNKGGIWMNHILGQKVIAVNWGKGVHRYDLNKKQYSHHLIDSDLDVETLYENQVNRLFKDRSGCIWACTSGGLLKIDVLESNFKIFSPLAESIGPIFIDDSENIWIQLWNEGPRRYILEDNQFVDKTPEVLINQTRITALENLLSIFSPRNNVYWFCSGSGHGILEYFIDDKQDRFIQQYQVRDGLPVNNVNLIFNDSQQNIWAGTTNGIALYIKDNKSFLSKLNRSDSIFQFDYSITAIDQTDEDLWFGTQEGILIMHRKSGPSEIFNYPIVFSPGGGWIMSLKTQGDDILWIGTWNGLYKFDLSSESIEKIENKTFSTSTIAEIQIGNDGNLWLGTLSGLVRFNPNTLESNTFRPGEGIRINHINWRASDYDRNGNLYFGSIAGVVYFNPVQITKFAFPTEIAINRLLIENQTFNIVKISSGTTEQFDYILELPYKNNSLSFEFTGLSYLNQDMNKYSYRLSGLSDVWSLTDFRGRFINYSNLSPGDYVFEVAGSNHDGFWNPDPLKISIHIKQIFWKTKFAIGIYILIALGISTLIYFNTRARRRLNEELLHEKLERKKVEEINEIKLKFFTNISHEFRSPLTMIINPIEKLIDNEFREGARKEMERIRNNASRMLNLINQVLDFRKVTSQGIAPYFIKGNIETFVNKQVNHQKPVADSNNQTLIFKSSLKEKLFVFDKFILEKIISNLISNACKFSPSGSEIKILLQNSDQLDDSQIQESGILLDVLDKGKGIPEKYMDQVFDRFFQVDSDGSGSGIGLSLVKELVSTHQGRISVESKVGEGSIFRVYLPNLRYDASLEQSQLTAQETGEVEIYKSISENAVKNKLLLVDDDKELIEYIANEFSSAYTIFKAFDGKEALDIVHKIHPDIIVSDVNMPELNGWELCQTIRSEMDYSHIPIILLTVEDSDKSREQGYDCGADSHLEKPISLNVLHTRIQNILKKKENSRIKFQSALHIEPKEIATTSMDEQFIRKALDIVEKNIDNPDFNSEVFCREIAVSSTQLYKKLKSLIGLSSSEFIKDIRLKRATQLLKNQSHTISEVAYMCGFADPKYFSKCFKNKFGVSPKRYSKSNSG